MRAYLMSCDVDVFAYLLVCLLVCVFVDISSEMISKLMYSCRVLRLKVIERSLQQGWTLLNMSTTQTPPISSNS